jgi:MFS family permease
MVVEICLGLPFRHPLLVVASLLLGIVAQGVKICVDTLVQESCDDAFRGRVFSLYDVMFNVAFVAAAAASVVLLPMTGKSTTALLVIAFGYGLTGATFAVVVSRSRSGEATSRSGSVAEQGGSSSPVVATATATATPGAS